MGGARRYGRSRCLARPDPAAGAATLAKDAATNERDPNYTVTVVGLLFYVVVVAGFLVLLDVD
jgi:hypothetical protein